MPDDGAETKVETTAETGVETVTLSAGLCSICSEVVIPAPRKCVATRGCSGILSPCQREVAVVALDVLLVGVNFQGYVRLQQTAVEMAEIILATAAAEQEQER